MCGCLKLLVFVALLSWGGLHRICVSLFEVVGVRCLLYCGGLTGLCVLLFEVIGALVSDIFVSLARSMCVVV